MEAEESRAKMVFEPIPARSARIGVDDSRAEDDHGLRILKKIFLFQNWRACVDTIFWKRVKKSGQWRLGNAKAEEAGQANGPVGQ